jgi:phosphoheptose isomerase
VQRSALMSRRSGAGASLEEATRRWPGAIALRRAFESGKLLALGNGGSSTDAMDLVADLRYHRRNPAGRHAAQST